MSQNSFDLTQPPAPPDEQRWIPQPSTNQFEPPRILEYGPLQGHIGDTFHIDISNNSNIDPNLLKIAFDSCITTCHFTINTVTQVFTIHSIVPAIDSTSLSRIPIYLLLEQSEQILDSWFVGYFTLYTTTRKRVSSESPIITNTTNTTTIDTTNTIDPTNTNNEPKRSRQATNTTATTSDQPPPPQYNYTTTTSSNYYGLSPHAPYVGLPPTQPSPRPREYFEDNTMLGYPPPPSSAYRTTDTTTTTTNFQPSFNDGSYQQQQQQQQQQDPYIMPLMGSISQPTTILPTSSTSAIPTLQMKPTLPLPLPLPLQPQQQPQQQSNTTTTNYPPISISSSSNAPMLTSDPFANLLNKANLCVEGDLETMIKDWTADEWENQRRLVQFWRRQEGNEVTCRFETFQLPSEKSKQPDMSKLIVVSCIYWKEKNDYFITSVDCIYLLEHLIGVKFTVEEKNRIRRNLEGYKPLTVSKLKPESAEFFKLIMGFPNPKPRNIEKDVKVFSWATLGVALKKIISKYTASYSSTASVNYDVLTTTTTTTNTTTTTEPSSSPNN